MQDKATIYRDFIARQMLSNEGLLIWFDYKAPLMITSGEIEQSQIHENLLSVRAFTGKGQLALHAFEQGQVDDERLVEFFESSKLDKGRTSPARRFWKSTPTLIVAPSSKRERKARDVDSLAKPSIGVSKSHRHTARRVLSNQEVIDRLDNRKELSAETMESVLIAEVADFNASELQTVLPLLFSFVERNRFSGERDIQIAVGSALRKLIMNLSTQNLDSLAPLLDPTDTDSIPCELELEFVKSLVWRLTSDPVTDRDLFQRLLARMLELATTYIKPRLIMQKNYAAVAINTILALLLLQSSRLDELMAAVESLNMNWFRDLVLRRTEDLQAQISRQTSREAEIVSEFLTAAHKSLSTLTCEG